MKLFLIFAVFYSQFTFAANLQSPQYYWDLRSAAELLSKDKKSEALQLLVSMLEDHPFDIFVLYNMGVSFHALENKEKAQTLYQDLDKILSQVSDKEQLERIRKIRYFYLFNLGFIAADSKKRELAISYYQKALDIYPESREAKTNIELLMMSQSGGGEGEDKDKSDQGGQGDNKDEKKDQKEKDQDQKDKQDQQYKPNPTPQPFKSKELSKEDVRRILEELKRQEGKIWNRMNEKPQERQLEKDW